VPPDGILTSFILLTWFAVLVIVVPLFVVVLWHAWQPMFVPSTATLLMCSACLPVAILLAAAALKLWQSAQESVCNDAQVVAATLFAGPPNGAVVLVP
jgi:hypothetical protein